MGAQALLPAALLLFQCAAWVCLSFAALSLLKTWPLIGQATRHRLSDLQQSISVTGDSSAAEDAGVCAAHSTPAGGSEVASAASQEANSVADDVYSCVSAEDVQQLDAAPSAEPHGPVSKFAVVSLGLLLTPAFIAAAGAFAVLKACQRLLLPPLLLPVALVIQVSLVPVRVLLFTGQVLRFIAYISMSAALKSIARSAAIVRDAPAVQHTAQAIGQRYQTGRTQVRRVYATPPRTYLQHTANGIVRLALGSEASTRMTSHATRAQVVLRLTHAWVLLWLRCVWFVWCMPDHAAVFVQSLRHRATAARHRAALRWHATRDSVAVRCSMLRSKAVCRCIMAQHSVAAQLRGGAQWARSAGKQMLRHVAQDGACGAGAAIAAHYAGIFAYSVAANACSAAQVTSLPCSQLAEHAEAVWLRALMVAPSFLVGVCAVRQAWPHVPRLHPMKLVQQLQS